MKPAFDLDRLERWMLEVITHSQGAAAGADSPAARQLLDAGPEELERVVTPSRALTGLERVGIYAGMYHLRLQEILADDFAAVREAVGEPEFDRLTRDYLVRHPSRHYSLNRLGHAFPSYLAHEARDVPQRPFVAELAALERAVDEVFDAPRSPVLQPDALRELPAARWAEATFEVVPALRLFAFQYPVNEYYQAFREERHPAVPELRATWLQLDRRDFVVWRMDLDREQFALLSALRDGAPLGAVLARCARMPGVDLERLSGQLHDWFQTWAGQGVFAGIRLRE